MKKLTLVMFACFISICNAQTHETQDEKILIKYAQRYCESEVINHQKKECDVTGKYCKEWRELVLKDIRNNQSLQNLIQQPKWKKNRNDPEFVNNIVDMAVQEEAEEAHKTQDEKILIKLLQRYCESEVINHQDADCDKTEKYAKEWREATLQGIRNHQSFQNFIQQPEWKNNRNDPEFLNTLVNNLVNDAYKKKKKKKVMQNQ